MNISFKKSLLLSLTAFYFPLGAMAAPLINTASEATGNNPAAQNGANIGAYGQTPTDLINSGYMNDNGAWTGKNNIYSGNDYKDNPLAQEDTEQTKQTTNWTTLKNEGAESQFNGVTLPNGVTANEGNMLQCANELGADRCMSWMGNPNNSEVSLQAQTNDTAANMAKATNDDVSNATGHRNTVVDNNNIQNNNGPTGNMVNGCSKDVQTAIDDAKKQAVEQANILAGNSQTGYKMLNGKGMYDDARIGPDNRPLMSDVAKNISNSMGDMGMSAASCLDNLTSQIAGVGAIFNLPSLSSIASSLINQACGKAQQLAANNFSDSLNGALTKMNNVGTFQGNSWIPTQQLLSVSSGNGSNFVSSTLQDAMGSTNSSNSDLLGSHYYNLNMTPVSIIQRIGGLTSASFSK